MNGTARRIATILVALLTVSAGRADDVVVDEAVGGEAVGQGMAFVGGGGVELAQMFDSLAFADGAGIAMQVMGDVVTEEPMAGRPPAADNDAVVARGLEPVRQRLEAKIATIDRIVGLAEKQRKKLEIAAQSDLRRLTDAVAEARANYAGRTLQIDPRNGGFDEAAQKAMQEAQQDAMRCRELIDQASGPASLLAKVVTGTLDEPQASKYKAVMDGRRDCRWKAAVAAHLEQMDETLGLTQKQHDALTAALMAAPPAEDELAAAGPTQPSPAAFLAASRLAALIGSDATLAAVLDPRQRAVASVSGAMEGGMPVNGAIQPGNIAVQVEEIVDP